MKTLLITLLTLFASTSWALFSDRHMRVVEVEANDSLLGDVVVEGIVQNIGPEQTIVIYGYVIFKKEGLIVDRPIAVIEDAPVLAPGDSLEFAIETEIGSGDFDEFYVRFDAFVTTPEIIPWSEVEGCTVVGDTGVCDFWITTGNVVGDYLYGELYNDTDALMRVSVLVSPFLMQAARR